MTFSAWYKFVISTALLGAVGCGGGGSSGAAVGGAGGEGGEGGANDVPAFSISDVEIKEGNVGSTDIEFTVTLSHALDEVAKVNYETEDDTATSEQDLEEGGRDYESAGSTLTFDPGETEQTFQVTVYGDRLLEDDETFRVKLYRPIGAALPDAYGVGTILNDEPKLPAISIDGASITEGDAGTKSAAFTVTLSDATDVPVSVNFASTGGTATAGEDYRALDGSLTFAAGEVEQVVTVLINGDTVLEADETLTVTLSGPRGATLGTAEGTLTILNDDADSGPTLTVNDASVSEGNFGTKTLAFTIQLSAPSAGVVTVDYATVDGTASSSGVSASGGSDYASTSDSLVFAAGETSKQVSITLYGDTLNEANETFTVELYNGSGALIVDPQGVGTITNDDTLPSVSVADGTVIEGAAGTRIASFAVSLSQASGQQVSVNFATANVTATAGVDYTAASGKLTFAPGQTTAFVSVTVAGDLLDEDDELFSVGLSSPVSANISDSQGQGKIFDDDDVPQLSIADVSIIEGDAGTKSATFNVTLSAVSGRSVTVGWSTNDSSALAGQDYVAASGVLDFPPGTTLRTVLVLVNGDLLDEPNESFTVDLSSPGQATVADSQGTGTIITDDSSLPGLNIADASVNEGASGTATLSLTVTLDAVSAQQVKVNYTTVDDMAVSASDYQSASGTLTFAAGETVKKIDVLVNGDALHELDETLYVILSTAVNAFVADGVGLGTIFDDDAEPTLSVDDLVITEGNAGKKSATFSISLSVPSGMPVSVSYATIDGTAVEAGTLGAGQDDYEATSNNVVIAAGATTAQVSVSINGDALTESNETFQLSLSAPQNATIADGTGQCTITNDDGLPSITINDVAAVEGDAGSKTFTFTLTLSGPSGNQVSVDYATADVTAASGSDYDAAIGTVIFNPGQTTATIDVVVRGDTATEAKKNETFVLDLSNVLGATVSDAQATGTILNDD